jgi:hypothetical protein
VHDEGDDVRSKQHAVEDEEGGVFSRPDDVEDEENDVFSKPDVVLDEREIVFSKRDVAEDEEDDVFSKQVVGEKNETSSARSKTSSGSIKTSSARTKKSFHANHGGIHLETRTDAPARPVHGGQQRCCVHPQLRDCGSYVHVESIGQPSPASTGAQSPSLMQVSAAVWQ